MKYVTFTVTRTDIMVLELEDSASDEDAYNDAILNESATILDQETLHIRQEKSTDAEIELFKKLQKAPKVVDA